MQTDAQAEAIAYDNELRAAERHMEGSRPDGGSCANCANFREVECSDGVPNILRQQLSYCGLCVMERNYPIVVDRSETHSWDECWTEG